MLEQRYKGCLWSLTVALGLANAGLFFLYMLLERRFELYGLVSDERVFVYLLAVPVSLAYSRTFLRGALDRVQAPSLWHSGITALQIIFLQAVTIFGIYFILKDVALSRAYILGYLALALLLNFILVYSLPTLVMRYFFREQQSLRAVLYGFGPLPNDLRDYILRSRSIGIRVIGYYADEALELPGIEWLGTTREVLSCEGGRKHIRLEMVLAYSDDPHREEFREGVDLCQRRGARVHIYSNLSSTFLDPIRVVTDGKILFLSFFDEPLQNPLNQHFKRALDILISLPVVLFILPPLTLLVWIMQSIESPGPLFFRQTRYGMNRRSFNIYKFRTMHVHDRSEEGKQATKGDSRIFPFGAFLRRSSLDEFPQFINSLRGEMSVVGPRPHLTLHDRQFEKYFRRYRSRHFVKPGITGLAQVSGYRGEASNEEAIIGRVEHDLRYIAKWSPAMEFYIILKTAWQITFPPKTAY